MACMQRARCLPMACNGCKAHLLKGVLQQGPFISPVKPSGVIRICTITM